ITKTCTITLCQRIESTFSDHMPCAAATGSAAALRDRIVVMKRAAPAILLYILYVSTLFAQPPVESLDYLTIAKIRDEGLNRSQVMDQISWLSDVYGPRLTGTPAILQASDWALKKFKEWGLANAHRATGPSGEGGARV